LINGATLFSRQVEEWCWAPIRQADFGQCTKNCERISFARAIAIRIHVRRASHKRSNAGFTHCRPTPGWRTLIRRASYKCWLYSLIVGQLPDRRPCARLLIVLPALGERALGIGVRRLRLGPSAPHRCETHCVQHGAVRIARHLQLQQLLEVARSLGPLALRVAPVFSTAFLR
jgi:hypothetical protein